MVAEETLLSFFLKLLQSEMKDMIRFQHVKGSSSTKFHNEIVSDYGKNDSSERFVAQITLSGINLVKGIDCDKSVLSLLTTNSAWLWACLL